MAKQFALLLAIVLTSGVTLHGHAELVRTDPPGDAVLEAGPVALRLWFSEPVDAPADAIVIIDPTGTRVDLNDARPAADDAMALGVSLRANAHGTYVVRWRAISADSHPISGSFVFSVGTPGPPAESVLDGQSTTSPLLIVGQAIVRWAHLLALSLIWGPVVLWHLFEPP